MNAMNRWPQVNELTGLIPPKPSKLTAKLGEEQWITLFRLVEMNLTSLWLQVTFLGAIAPAKAFIYNNLASTLAIPPHQGGRWHPPCSSTTRNRTTH
jgi:hypothetical protein